MKLALLYVAVSGDYSCVKTATFDAAGETAALTITDVPVGAVINVAAYTFAGSDQYIGALSNHTVTNGVNEISFTMSQPSLKVTVGGNTSSNNEFLAIPDDTDVVISLFDSPVSGFPFTWTIHSSSSGNNLTKTSTASSLTIKASELYAVAGDTTFSGSVHCECNVGTMTYSSSDLTGIHISSGS